MLFTQTNNGTEVGDKPSIKTLFYPNSIAVIGASATPHKLGHIILKNIIESGYKGEIYPVNPTETLILDQYVTSNVSELPKGLDLAVVVIPQTGVAEVIRELGYVGTKFVSVISAGYKEIGNQTAEDELVKICKEYGIQLLGPNCLGLMNLGPDSSHQFNASFGFTPKMGGKIALISQSGALISSITDRASQSGFGFGKVVSIGNKAGIDEVDLINYFTFDQETEVIALYLEGINRGREFVKALSICQKPVILLKAGKGQKTKEAISSHTGSVAGDDQVAKMFLENVNVVMPNDLDEFFNTLFLFSKFHRFHSKPVCVITNAGGAGVLSLDGFEGTNLVFENVALPTQTTLRGMLPAAANVHNPIDVLGDAGVERYARACREIALTEQFGALVVILTPQVNTEIEDTAQMLINLASDNIGTPILPVFIGGDKVIGAITLFKQAKLPYFETPEQALKALNNLANFSHINQVNLEFLENHNSVLSESEHGEVLAMIATNKKENLPALDFMSVTRVSQLFGLPMPKFRLFNKIASKEELEPIFALEEFRDGVVMKVVSAGELHRTDKNMVEVGIKTPEKAIEFMSNFPGQQIIIQQMSPKGFEIFLGIKNDVQFGRVLVVGSGGVYTEIWEDFAIGAIPISREKIVDLFKKTKAHKILEGYRGKKYDVQTVVEVAYNLSKLALEFPEITSLDMNPLIVLENGAVAVDLKILV